MLGRWTIRSLCASPCVALGLACGDGAPTAPGSRRLMVLTPGELAGTVGTAVATAPVVMVGDERGMPISRALVRFSVATGHVTDADVLTDARGTATPGRWVLGPLAGPQALMVATAGATIRITADARPDVPVRLVPRSEPVQVGFARDIVDGPVVAAVDRFGNAARDVEARFEVMAGDSRLNGATHVVARSDARGHASGGVWALGPSPGVSTVRVSVAGLEPIVFVGRALDASAVVWYEVTEKRIGSMESPPVTEYEHVRGRIALSRVDPCLCRVQSGEFIERGTYWSGDAGTLTLNGAGTFTLEPSVNGTARMRLVWSVGLGPDLWAGGPAAGPAWMDGERILVERTEPGMGFTEVWVYTRVPGPIAGATRDVP